MSTTTYTLPAGTATPPKAYFSVADEVAGITTVLVNVFLVGPERSSDWVLVDAGLPGFAQRIIGAAEARFGNSAPQAIILTHGHFDHRGSLPALLERWPETRVYAHELEFPYLTGRASYPPPDPTVGGGMIARTSLLLPRRPIDISSHLYELPRDGSVPHLAGWRWVHTPGHTPGHVALFRDSDATLLPGDAFCTQKQESVTGALTQRSSIEGPPRYFTTDWKQARESVRRLAALRPAAAAPGHGLPLFIPRLTQDLDYLVDNFDRIATPRDGRYVREPAGHDVTGAPAYIPPPVRPPLARFAATLGVIGLAAGAAAMLFGRDD